MYHPLDTAWLVGAERSAPERSMGSGMLVHQAALQQLAWLGATPDTAAMRAAAEAELARRS